MRKRLALIPVAMLCSFSAAASMQEYHALEKQALAGDYQAQRSVTSPTGSPVAMAESHR